MVKRKNNKLGSFKIVKGKKVPILKSELFKKAQENCKKLPKLLQKEIELFKIYK